jgi:hypothetical protein
VHVSRADRPQHSPVFSFAWCECDQGVTRIRGEADGQKARLDLRVFLVRDDQGLRRDQDELDVGH